MRATRTQEYFSRYTCILTSVNVMSNSVTPCTAACQASLPFTVSFSLLKLIFIESVMPFNHIILCHPLSPPTLGLSKHQGLFHWVSSSRQVATVFSVSASVPPMNIQDWSPLRLTGWSPCGPRDSHESSQAPVWKHPFFSAQHSLWLPYSSNSHICTWLLQKPYLWLYGP